MKRSKVNMNDIKEYLYYKITNGTETDQEYSLYLSIIAGESNVKEIHRKLFKSLVKEIITYEEFGI